MCEPVPGFLLLLSTENKVICELLHGAFPFITVIHFTNCKKWSGPVRSITNLMTIKFNLHNEGDIYIQVVINLHRAETKRQTVAINCLII